jgi:hypothetical protein
MLKRYRKWRQKLSAEIQAAQYSNGYAYAAGKLLRSNGSIECITRLEMKALGWEDFHAFDRGIVAALAAWRSLLKVSDPCADGNLCNRLQIAQNRMNHVRTLLSLHLQAAPEGNGYVQEAADLLAAGVCTGFTKAAESV